jgi:pimeloyl-ACP methyl ester carboxylesterase
MATYVLVHGSWHAGWCWYKLKARLEASGHKVLAPDLPGLGLDHTPFDAVTLALWRDRVCDVVKAQTDRVILVGHSRGGIVVSEVAERVSGRIRTLVYLSAFLARDGQSLFDVLSAPNDSEVPANITMSKDRMAVSINLEAVRSAFYGECSDEDVALARSLLQPEPAAPLGTPVHVTEENFGRVPRVYIECLRDRAIPLPLQRAMLAETPCRRVLSIDTDHSPFLSRPDELSAHLQAIAASGA